MTAGFLVAVIIIITSFVLIAGTLMRFMSTADDRQAETLCKDSVALRAATALQAAGSEVKLAPVLCKTIDKKVKKNKEETKEEFAQKMAKCWEIFGEGRYRSNIFRNTNIFGGNNLCFMCYSLLVDGHGDFTEESKGITSSEFESYLADNNHPLRDQKYLEYFQYGSGPGYVLSILTEEGIKPGRAYAILYKAKSDDPTAGTGLLVGGGAAATLGAVSFFTLGVGGGLLLGGALAFGTGFVTEISSLFSGPRNIDAIMLVDMSNPQLGEVINNHCTFIPDIAGV